MERKQIGLAIDYIESHLKDDLNNKMLAKLFGYSEYHFIRIFRKHVSLTPADYIRKRRISEIVRHIDDKKRTISDIAFEYGFNSKENFTRAFKSEHGILPSEWKNANCSLKLFAPFEFEFTRLKPTVSMQYFNPFTLICYPFDVESPPICWNKYNSEKRSLRLSGGNISEDFGVMIWSSEKEKLIYYIGIKSDEAKGDKADTLRINIAGGLYAVFETPPADEFNFVSTIRSTWDYIYREWLPESGYDRADGFELESYIEESKKYTERIYVPIKAEI